MPSQPSIDRALMDHLAELARLDVPLDRAPALRQRLERIVAAFSALRDGEAVEAGAPGQPALALRQDCAAPPMPVAEVLANAPQQAAGAFVVPRVVDA